jgi:hypothetical protein
MNITAAIEAAKVNFMGFSFGTREFAPVFSSPAEAARCKLLDTPLGTLDKALGTLAPRPAPHRLFSPCRRPRGTADRR